MNESGDRLKASVDDVFGAFEWSPLGFREYQDVTEQVRALQDSLLDHLETFDYLGEYDEIEDAIIMQMLTRYIQRDFMCLDSISLDDEVIIPGPSSLITTEGDDYYSQLPIGRDTLLHGKVDRVDVMNVPALESTDCVENGSEPLLLQKSVVLEIDMATIESRQSGESRFFDLPDNSRVFLPMVYSDVKIKRRVDNLSLEGDHLG